MKAPPEPVASALRSAAVGAQVPVTLLAAVAYKESQYNPRAFGPATKKGWHAQGLMQLSPDVMKAFGVKDGFDAVANARAGASYLAQLYKRYGYWEPALAAYNWGPSHVDKASAASTPSVGPPVYAYKQWPQQVQNYVTGVIGNRRWLQSQAAVGGATAAERLNNAINRLEFLNPQDPEIRTFAKLWSQWWNGQRRVIGDSVFLSHPQLVVSWHHYGKLYDRAPITDARTPTPEMIEPVLWSELATKLERQASNVSEAVTAAGSGLLGSATVGIALAAIVLWVMYGRSVGREDFH